MLLFFLELNKRACFTENDKKALIASILNGYNAASQPKSLVFSIHPQGINYLLQHFCILQRIRGSRGSPQSWNRRCHRLQRRFKLALCKSPSYSGKHIQLVFHKSGFIRQTALSLSQKTWTDDRLRWESSDKGIQSVSIAVSKIW